MRLTLLVFMLVAVPLSAAGRVSDVVSVTDFGAVGDGVTDDTAAVQAAVDAGGYIYVPPGNFKITTAITLSGTKSLIGAGRNLTMISAVGCGALVLRSQHNEVRNLHLSGDNSSGKYGIEIVNNPRGAELSNLFVRGFGTSGNGAGVYLHNNETFDAWGSHFSAVIVEDNGRGFVFENTGATTLVGCIARLNRGHNLYAYNATALSVVGGVYENPSGAATPQYNIWLEGSHQVVINGIWSENAVTTNLRIANCTGVALIGVLLSNTAENTPNVSIVSSSRVSFAGGGNRILMDAGEIGVSIDSKSSYIDTSGVTFEAISGAVTPISDASASGLTVNVTNGATLPSGTGGPTTEKFVNITSTQAVSTGATTSFLAGRDGHHLTLVNIGPNPITIKHGANVRLSSGVDFVMGQYATLTIQYVSALGTWVEVARSNNA